MDSDKTVWMIRIAGYGTFEFTGTEAKAEAMRSHKANWERGSGMMWRKDQARESDRIGAQIAALFDEGKGISTELLRARKAAREKEASHG